MQELPITFVSLKSSFINIPIRWTSALWDLSPLTAFEISFNQKGVQKVAYFQWSGGCSKCAERETLEIDFSYKNSLNLKENQLVKVKTVKVPLGKRISVEPMTVDDWEILELNAGLLEEQFLNQVRVVYLNQIITIWLDQSSIRVQVGGKFINKVSIESDETNTVVVVLDNDSEVIVAPKVRKQFHTQTCSIIRKVYPLEWTAESITFRNQIILHENDGIEENSLVYLQNMDYDHLVLPVTDLDDSQTQNKVIRGCFAKVVLKSVNLPLLDSNLFQELGIYPLSRIRITTVSESDQSIKKSVSFETAPCELSSTVLVKCLKDSIRRRMDPVFILYDRQRIMINIDSELKETMIKIKSADSTSDILKNVPFIILNSRNIDHCEFLHVATQDFKSRPSHCLSLLYGETKMVGYDKPIDCIKEYFKSCIVHEKVYPDYLPLCGVHIYGGIGSGKTSLCRNIAEYMAKFHNFCTITFNLVPVWVDCESLKSNSLSKTKEHLERAMMQASWHAPSLLIFDDLDSLIFNESEMEISLKGKQLAHFFAEQVIERSETQSVYYLVSSIDKTSLHSHLTQSHLFGKTLHLKFPSKKERIEIMKNLLNFEPSNLNMSDICTRMDGYSLADMNFFYESAVKEMTLRHIKQNAPKKLIMDDFEKAFESFKPFSISKGNVETSKVEWNSVGGMVETKKMLLETLKWPTMYPQIFDKCPLRLRSGILLYGYPGCGKTMLANAVAKECGLNFISVKGPELLNKYIGASEKAVRDLFERARGCKPCCLFFDEFDSVAPQRGHDNSGVTDRVVNQLLTEMDGAEGLDGVYVLAATSRPEMIDPALLRPGRLDKAIFCDIPNYEERLDIIRTVKETIVLSPEINVGIIATKTQGCSGADIQSLLYTAHLSAINERIATQSLNESVETSSHPFTVVQGDVDRATIQDELNVIVGRKQNTNMKYIKEKIIVTEKHMNSALSNCRPSLRNEEFLKLKHSYLKFQGVEQPKKEVGIRALYG